MPPKLAANLPALLIPFTSAFTPIVAAVEPVKNVLSPNAASIPLVSPENANSISDESDESCKPPVDVTLAEMPSIASSCCAKLGERRVFIHSVQVDVNRVRVRRVAAFAVNEQIERAAHGRKRQAGRVQCRAAIAHRFDAGQFLKADEPLPLGIRFVEFKRERAGQVIQLAQETAHDLDRGPRRAL